MYRRVSGGSPGGPRGSPRVPGGAPGGPPGGAGGPPPGGDLGLSSEKEERNQALRLKKDKDTIANGSVGSRLEQK